MILHKYLVLGLQKINKIKFNLYYDNSNSKSKRLKKLVRCIKNHDNKFFKLYFGKWRSDLFKTQQQSLIKYKTFYVKSQDEYLYKSF